jgi:hypothetical protein
MSDDQPCLHCLILDLLEDYFEKRLGRHGERVVLSLDEILTAFGLVLAELMAADDDDARCMGALLTFAFEVYQKSGEVRARGEAVGEVLRPC